MGIHWIDHHELLRGAGAPFEYAISNFSPNELRIVPWMGTAIVTWYGALLVVAGTAMIPLGASLLWILWTCRYMRG